MTDKPKDEELMRLADGAVTPEEREALRRAVEADPQARERLAAHRRLAGVVHDAYAPVLQEEVPGQLRALVEQAAERTSAGTSPAGAPGASLLERASEWLRSFISMQSMALAAAGLALGVFVAGPIFESGGMLREEGAQLVAAGPLERALTAAPSGTQGEIRIGMTFRDRSGAWCRTFTAADRNRVGFACRRDGAWTVRALATIETETDGGAYRMAASPFPPELRTLIENQIAGGPLDAEAEARTIRDDWSRNAPATER